MGKARKAVWAFVTGTLGAAGTALLTGGTPTDAAGWAGLIGAALGAGIVAAVAVYRATNDPAR